MDFTREPIIETVITPKEGCKLVVRSSKGTGQEEHFVDAVEVVSFGHSFFFRSLERPKTFLVPATDYEILEVREARMVLKNVGIERSIKIGGGREGHMRSQKEKAMPIEEREVEAAPAIAEKPQEGRAEYKVEKKRDRRRNYRRRRGREAGAAEEESREGESGAGKVELPEPRKGTDLESGSLAQQVITTSILTSLLPPPPTLISETIGQYKDKFKDAFYAKGEEKPFEEEEPEGEEEPSKTPLKQAEYESFDMTVEEKEQENKSPHLEDEDFPPADEGAAIPKNRDEM